VARFLKDVMELNVNVYYQFATTLTYLSCQNTNNDLVATTSCHALLGKIPTLN
jgi:hypothetical protein